MSEYHFIISDGDGVIAVWNGHDGYTPIAQIIDNRACHSLLRHAHLAEEIEALVDKFLASDMARPGGPPRIYKECPDDEQR